MFLTQYHDENPLSFSLDTLTDAVKEMADATPFVYVFVSL